MVQGEGGSTGLTLPTLLFCKVLEIGWEEEWFDGRDVHNRSTQLPARSFGNRLCSGRRWFPFILQSRPIVVCPISSGKGRDGERGGRSGLLFPNVHMGAHIISLAASSVLDAQQEQWQFFPFRQSITNEMMPGCMSHDSTTGTTAFFPNHLQRYRRLPVLAHQLRNPPKGSRNMIDEPKDVNDVLVIIRTLNVCACTRECGKMQTLSITTQRFFLLDIDQRTHNNAGRQLVDQINLQVVVPTPFARPRHPCRTRLQLQASHR
ncbi:hypothetical protein V8F33_000600 [Rhypophila sp. PSN 637]